MTVSEVAATGMEQLYPGVCSESLYYIPSYALSRRYVQIPVWASDVVFSTTIGNARASDYGMDNR